MFIADNKDMFHTFTPLHNFFVGVDSDGTIFDTMVIKHKKVLIPIAIKVFRLEHIKKVFYEIAEDINLYSKNRGINRFLGLYMSFEQVYLRANDMHIEIPIYPLEDLKQFIDLGVPLSNAELIKYIDKNESWFLKLVLRWSQEGDNLFAEYAKGLKPYKNVKEALEKIFEDCDTMIVSAATTAGLYEDWGAAGILDYMTLVAGQEFGNKEEQLSLAVKGRYESKQILMIGDALGDKAAAIANKALFYPILPGKEEQSWKRFLEEGYQRFLEGTFEGEYQKALFEEFDINFK